MYTFQKRLVKSGCFTEHSILCLKFLLMAFGGRKVVEEEEELIKMLFSKCLLLSNVGSSILGKIDFSSDLIRSYS